MSKKKDEPKKRETPTDEPRMTTMGGGEPEKRFGGPKPDVPKPDTGKETPRERPLPDEPVMTTMGGEPEKNFGGPTPDMIKKPEDRNKDKKDEDKPNKRPLPGDRPVATTLAVGEPEKRFTI